MAWWNGSLAHHRRAGIVAGVTAVHVAGLAAIVSHVFQPGLTPDRNYLEVELAEIELPPAEPEPEVTIAPLPDPAPEPTEPLPIAPVTVAPAVPDPSPPDKAAPETDTQNVLTQLQQSEESSLTSDADNEIGIKAGEGDGMVTPAQIANVLQQADCLKLKRHEEGACPEPDPFAVAIASAKRAIPPERLFADPRYVGKTVSDKIFEEEASNRFHWPDEDLFTDPMYPGAYNARRIRNGQEPLWSKEMRDGFTKRD
ncbi:MAG: hypothetical protein AAFP24_12180 [Pseudomonadota bacterium]